MENSRDTLSLNEGQARYILIDPEDRMMRRRDILALLPLRKQAFYQETIQAARILAA